MDDLEFRRRLLADPFDNSQDMAEARNASITNRKLSDELQQLDSKLEQAMKVDVPDDSRRPHPVPPIRPAKLEKLEATLTKSPWPLPLPLYSAYFVGQYNQGVGPR